MGTRAAPAAVRRVALAGLVALALLAFGEAATAALPVPLTLLVEGDQVTVLVDGGHHGVSGSTPGSWRAVRFEQPDALLREYQIDGTDLTFTLDRDPEHIQRLQGTPLYALDGWLRDESSFSRWERVQLADGASGAVLARGADDAAAARLPAAFRLDAAVRRLEAPARLWLLRQDDGSAREGVELDRDGRHVRWLAEAAGTTTVVASWFFPEQPLPFLAELAHQLGRSAAAGFAILATVCLVGLAATPLASVYRGHAPGGILGARVRSALPRWFPLVALVVWTSGATWISVRLYRQLPHVLDAVSYTFQAGIFRSGHLWLAAPASVDALRGPFEVVSQGRWFSQYPPGAPAVYALGGLVGMGWLVGPAAGVVMIAATAWSAGHLFGPREALITVGLGAISPLILFQAGSFLSHPISGAVLALALAALVHAEGAPHGRPYPYVALGVLLGAAFAVREVAAVIFALPLLAVLGWRRRWRALGWLAVGVAPLVVVYLGYNAALTGSPLVLPRALFDARDHFGFGDGIGFYGRHTPAAGLLVADELLTLLQFDLFGWPPLFNLGVLTLPVLLLRPTRADLLLVLGAGLFVATYTLYFASGVALGPRYYYEALPWLLPLAARGLLAALAAARALGAGTLASRVALLGVLGCLCMNTAFYYLPRQVERRTGFSDLPYRRRASVPFVETGLFGPRLRLDPALGAAPLLIVTDDWWLHNVVLAPLNCPDLDRSALAACPALFALATGSDQLERLRAQFPDRTVVRAVDNEGVVELVP